MFTTDNKDLLNGLIKIAVKLNEGDVDQMVQMVGHHCLSPHAENLGITIDELIIDLVEQSKL